MRKTLLMVSVTVFVLCFAYLANAIYDAINGSVQESGTSAICLKSEPPHG